MNNEELNEKAVQYALGTLPRSEVESFEQRLETDRELQNSVHEWQRLNEEHARDCEQIDVPFQAFSRIMSEVDTVREADASKPASRKQTSAALTVLTWGGWAAAACLAVVFGVALTSDAGSNGRQLLASEPASDIIVKDLGNPAARTTVLVNHGEDEFQDRLMELTGLAEAYWFSREGLPPESDDSVDAQEFSGGFTIYDRKIKIGVIGIENIPDSRLGTYYNVWAKTSNDNPPVWAGMLKSDEAGSQLAFFDLSSNEAIEDMDERISFFVTEDKSKRPEQPEGPVVLSGI